MRYQVLATDYDGTLAHDGRVSEATLNSLKRFLASGRRLMMVSGRELPELKAVFPELHLFHWVVAENGGLLYEPATNKELLIGNPPSLELVESLRRRGVEALSVGQCVVATWTPHENVVLEVIRDLGLELQIIFNKGAVMILPAGVNKAFGLARALKEMKFSLHNTVGVGDAENDHAFLQVCEFSAAVANALPSLKGEVDLVLPAAHGGGVEWLIDRILADDLRSFDRLSDRHRLPFVSHDCQEITMPSFGTPILICGSSGSGKSSLANKMVDSIAEQSYQFCIIDPEGDYEALDGAVVLGGPSTVPTIEEAIHVLEDPSANVVICLTGVPIPDRPNYFLQLVAELMQLRVLTGRPHWLILDEAHHLMPADWLQPADWLPGNWMNVILITVKPDLLPVSILKRVELLALVGADTERTAGEFAAATQIERPDFGQPPLAPGEVWLWRTQDPSHAVRCRALKSHREHTRHLRKYAEGQLPVERSFYFRGPEGKLNLRAQNLILFCQLAEGLDDSTWSFHLRNGDYSRWFQDCIKDDRLAAETTNIASLPGLSDAETRNRVLAAIRQNYTLSAPPPVTLPGAS